jgi:hypothetical protein
VSGAEPRRHAIRPRHGFVSRSTAVPLAPTFCLGWLGRVLPAACAVGDKTAHGFSGYAGNNLIGSLRSTAHRRAGVNRKRLNITAHYPKSSPFIPQAPFCGRPLRALRVRVMVCYVLRPSPDNGYFSSRCSGCLFRRCALGGGDSPARPAVGLRRLALRCSFPPRPPRARPPPR